MSVDCGHLKREGGHTLKTGLGGMKQCMVGFRRTLQFIPCPVSMSLFPFAPLIIYIYIYVYIYIIFIIYNIFIYMYVCMYVCIFVIHNTASDLIILSVLKKWLPFCKLLWVRIGCSKQPSGSEESFHIWTPALSRQIQQIQKQLAPGQA